MKRLLHFVTLFCTLTALLPLPGAALQICFATDHVGFATTDSGQEGRLLVADSVHAHAHHDHPAADSCRDHGAAASACNEVRATCFCIDVQLRAVDLDATGKIAESAMLPPPPVSDAAPALWLTGPAQNRAPRPPPLDAPALPLLIKATTQILC